MRNICLGLGEENSTNLEITENRTMDRNHLLRQELLDEAETQYCEMCFKPKTLLFTSIFVIVVAIPFVALFMVKLYYSKQNDEFPYKHYEGEPV